MQLNELLTLKCPICDSENTKELYENADWFFCRCGVIFQDKTNLENIYHKDYFEKYNHEGAKACYQRQVEFFLPKMKGISFLEIGNANDFVLDAVLAKGWFPTKIDINDYSDISRYPTLIGNFEDYDFNNKKYDCIWASHVWEHFIEPVKALEKTYDLLEDNGWFYVSMPDVYYFFIPTTTFGHLHRKEHYIMWTMESFEKKAHEVGFKTIYRGRNPEPGIFISWNDFHLILQKGDNL